MRHADEEPEVRAPAAGAVLGSHGDGCRFFVARAKEKLVGILNYVSNVWSGKRPLGKRWKKKEAVARQREEELHA